MTILRSLTAVRRIAAAAPRQQKQQCSFSTLYNLEDEFPGLPSTSPSPSSAPSGSVSTLSNGLTVVSEASSSSSTVTLTYPSAGSASELADESGAALLNKNLAFKSGSDMSTIRIARTIETEGGTPWAAVSRTAATLGFTVAPDRAAALVPLLAVDCSFEKWDVRDARSVATNECTEAATSAQIVLTENLFAAAYGAQAPAGRPLYATDASVDAIVAFRERNYGLSGAVLAATGVADHAAFCGQIEGLLGESSGSATAAGTKPDLTYLGGEARVAAPSSGVAHVALAFPAPTSSAVTKVVEQLWTLAGAPAGVSGFSTDGLVGVYGNTTADGNALVDALVTTIKASSDKSLVARAKTLAKAEALFEVDASGSAALAQAMTASVLESQTFANVAAVAKAFDSVTDAQVAQAVTALAKAKPALAAVGDITTVPYHATVAQQLQ